VSSLNNLVEISCQTDADTQTEDAAVLINKDIDENSKIKVLQNYPKMRFVQNNDSILIENINQEYCTDFLNF
jgi:hypothetical protein